MNCEPCEARGFIRAAKRIAGGTNMCVKCFKGESIGKCKVVCSIIPVETIPDTFLSVVHEGVKTLKLRSGVALKLQMNGVSAAKVQQWSHTYAERLKIKIKTRTVDGILYVERDIKAEAQA